MNETSIAPKVTVLVDPETAEVKVFFGEDEFPHEVWMAKSETTGFGDPVVHLEIPASAVEFKKN